MQGVPEQIGRYRIRSILGIGGFGVVVSAFDEALDAHVAIKILARSTRTTPKPASDSFARHSSCDGCTTPTSSRCTTSESSTTVDRTS